MSYNKEDFNKTELEIVEKNKLARKIFEEESRLEKEKKVQEAQRQQ